MQIETLHHQRRHTTPWHEHDSGQLYWVTRGLVVVDTGQDQWTITPGTLGWFPAGMSHRAQVPGELRGHCIYLPPVHCHLFPVCAGIFAADGFIAGLLGRLCQFSQSEPRDGYQVRLLTVLSDEIALAPTLPLHIVLPTDRRACVAAQTLLEHPENELSQEQLAQQSGLSVRTLSRLFRQQTGLTFSQWRQQAKLITSLPQVLAGEPVSTIAACSGYTNVSAFITAFRQRFGVTPGQFLARGVSQNEGGITSRSE